MVPRLPRPFVTLLAHIVSTACFLSMSKERSAVIRNLARVTGADGPAGWKLAYQVFYNFSRFMVAYACLRRYGPAWLLERLDGAEPVARSMGEALAEGRGLIVFTMHLGQWDMGLSLLDRLEVPVHVVMQRSEPDAVSKMASDARDAPELRVHQVGDSPLLGVELMAALLRGEIVAVQGDRAAGANVLPTPLFGADAPLPTGPVRLALATGAPIVPVFTLLGPGDRFRLISPGPLRLALHRGDGIDQAVRDAMPRVAAMMESTIARHPDQWFNFFDVWPQADEPGSEAEDDRD